MGMEVYSVDEVTSADPTIGPVTNYEPFYSFKHGAGPRGAAGVLVRHAAGVDAGERPRHGRVSEPGGPGLQAAPAGGDDAGGAHDLHQPRPGRHLQRAGDQLYLELEAAAPLAGAALRAQPDAAAAAAAAPRGPLAAAVAPEPQPPVDRRPAGRARRRCRRSFGLYDFSDPESGQQLAEVTRLLIEGVTAVSSRRVVGRTGASAASGFCRGVEITVEFDEEKYVGTGVYLVASVLERFLGLYASLNSFTQLVARIKQGEGVVKKWPPRAGEQVLV